MRGDGKKREASKANFTRNVATHNLLSNNNSGWAIRCDQNGSINEVTQMVFWARILIFGSFAELLIDGHTDGHTLI